MVKLEKVFEHCNIRNVFGYVNQDNRLSYSDFLVLYCIYLRMIERSKFRTNNEPSERMMISGIRKWEGEGYPYVFYAVKYGPNCNVISICEDVDLETELFSENLYVADELLTTCGRDQFVALVLRIVAVRLLFYPMTYSPDLDLLDYIKPAEDWNWDEMQETWASKILKAEVVKDERARLQETTFGTTCTWGELLAPYCGKGKKRKEKEGRSTKVESVRTKPDEKMMDEVYSCFSKFDSKNITSFKRVMDMKNELDRAFHHREFEKMKFTLKEKVRLIVDKHQDGLAVVYGQDDTGYRWTPSEIKIKYLVCMDIVVMSQEMTHQEVFANILFWLCYPARSERLIREELLGRLLGVLESRRQYLLSTDEVSKREE